MQKEELRASARRPPLLTAVYYEFVAGGLLGALQALAGLASSSILGSFVAAAIADLVPVLQPYRGWLIALVGTGTASLFLSVLISRRRNRPSYPPLDFDFEVVKKEIVHEFSSRQKSKHKRHFTLCARKRGLDRFRDQYRWTGSGGPVPESLVADQQVILTGRKNVWNTYEIQFPRMLDKGERIECWVEWNIDDTDESAVPFVSATVTEPTQELSFKVQLPPNTRITNAQCEVSSGVDARKPFSASDVPINSDSSIFWQLENPRLLQYYELRWTWGL